MLVSCPYVKYLMLEAEGDTFNHGPRSAAIPCVPLDFAALTSLQ